MAPHALTDHHDTSGYSPATDPLEDWLPNKKTITRLKSLAPKTGTAILNSARDSLGREGAKSPYFWHLGSNEISEIKNCVEQFQCMVRRHLEHLQHLIQFDQLRDCHSTLLVKIHLPSPRLSNRNSERCSKTSMASNNSASCPDWFLLNTLIWKISYCMLDSHVT